MRPFIDEHKAIYGVESICAMLPIAPLTYCKQKARQAHRSRLRRRAQRDAVLCEDSKRIWHENREVYGARKIWKQLCREDTAVARCTVERLMRKLSLQGVVRGRKPKITIPDDVAEQAADLVQRDFTATRPNQLWVADLTYIATWLGFVRTTFVIDAFSRRIVGWRVSRSLQSDLALEALDQGLYARKDTEDLVHHSDRGVQYLSIRYTEQPAEAGIEPSVGSVGDSYDNTSAETIIGPYKTEVIRHRRSWRNMEHVEFETLKWVDWFNKQRLLERIGDIPPVEFGELDYQNQEAPAMVAGLKQ